MPSWLGTPELIIILLIVVVLFGAGRLSRVFGEVGRGIREFRQGLKGDEAEADQEVSEVQSSPEEGGNS